MTYDFDKSGIAGPVRGTEFVKSHISWMEEKLKWWIQEGFSLLEKERPLTCPEWGMLFKKSSVLFRDACDVPSVAELFVCVCERGIRDFGACMADQKKAGTGDMNHFENPTRWWFYTLIYQFHPGRFESGMNKYKTDAKSELLDRLAMIVRENKHWLENVASLRYSSDDKVSQKLWTDYYRSLP